MNQPIYYTLGRTGLRVSRLSLGAMTPSQRFAYCVERLIAACFSAGESKGT